MKIFILGPILTNNYMGGVAIFDEEIGRGFAANGWDVQLLTNQKEAKGINDKNGIPVKYINYFIFNQLLAIEQPDVMISSLGYAKYFKRGMKSIKIYFLHGFFTKSYYGNIKAFIASSYQKLLLRKCDYIFANSYFTQMINREFFKIEADKVFHLGVTEKYFRLIAKSKNIKESKSIMFVGRLVTAKKVEVLLDALYILKSRNITYKAYIIGGGGEEQKLKHKAQDKQLPVIFTGRLEQTRIVEFYSKSEIFVSLNCSEPYGIVFIEALLARCKIVCPYTGGQVEYLSQYQDAVSFVDCNSSNSVADGIELLLTKGRTPMLGNQQKLEYSYEKIATHMIEAINL